MKITTMSGRRGSTEAHVTGCSHIARAAYTDPYGIRPSVHEGPDLLGAIKAADTDWAAAFCELPYTDSALENGAWTVRSMKIAPCLKVLIRAERITFDKVTGEPKAA